MSPNHWAPWFSLCIIYPIDLLRVCCHCFAKLFELVLKRDSSFAYERRKNFEINVALRIYPLDVATVFILVHAFLLYSLSDNHISVTDTASITSHLYGPFSSHITAVGFWIAPGWGFNLSWDFVRSIIMSRVRGKWIDGWIRLSWWVKLCNSYVLVGSLALF